MRDLAMPGLHALRQPRGGTAAGQAAPPARPAGPRPDAHPRPRRRHHPAGLDRADRLASGAAPSRASVGAPACSARPEPNMPRAISRAAVRTKSLKAPDWTTSLDEAAVVLLAVFLAVLRLLGLLSSLACRGLLGVLRVLWRLAGAVLELGRELLAGRLAVDGLGVLRVPRAGLDGLLHRGGVGRAHQRLGGAQPGPGHRGRRAALVHHGHDRLADAEAGDDLAEVVVRAGGVGVHGRLQRLGVVGRVGAELVLDPRAELGQHVVGHVGRALGDEEDADALGADQPHGLGDLVEEGLGGVVEEQVRLVEEEHQLGPVDVADLGQVVEEVGEQPHQERREDRRPVLEVGQLDEGDQPLALGRDLEQVVRLELRLAEERLGALVLEARSARAGSPRRSRSRARPSVLRSALPSSEVR